MGLIGLGRIGTHVSRRLAGWDVRLIASDPYVAPDRAAKLGVTLVDLPTLLAEADIVSLHCTLTDETRNLIGEKELRRMKPTALLINTARGEVVDEEAVARALGEKWIAGAAWTLVKEPMPSELAIGTRSRAVIRPAQYRAQRGGAAGQPAPGARPDPRGGAR